MNSNIDDTVENLERYFVDVREVAPVPRRRDYYLVEERTKDGDSFQCRNCLIFIVKLKDVVGFIGFGNHLIVRKEKFESKMVNGKLLCPGCYIKLNINRIPERQLNVKKIKIKKLVDRDYFRKHFIIISMYKLQEGMDTLILHLNNFCKNVNI